MKHIEVYVTNPDLAKFIIEMCKKHNIIVGVGLEKIINEDIRENRNILTFPFLILTLYNTGGSIGGNSSSRSTYTQVDINKFIEIISNVKFIEIKLNKEYKATYVKGDKVVKVGCQEIPVEIIHELSNQIKNL